jgi:hypothetical protein
VCARAQVYPPPAFCETCKESFVLQVELIRHRKFGCATERLRERLLTAQEREQRNLQVALGKRLREVVRLRAKQLDDDEYGLSEYEAEMDAKADEEEEEEEEEEARPRSRGKARSKGKGAGAGAGDASSASGATSTKPVPPKRK